MLRISLFLFLLCCMWEGKSAFANAPDWKVLLNLVDTEPDKAISRLIHEVKQQSYSKQEKAKLHQLLAVARYNTLKKGHAKDDFLRALHLDPQVPLLGEMSPLMRQQFEQWRKEYLASNPIAPPLASPNLLPSLLLMGGGLLALGVAIGLGVASQSEAASAEVARQNQQEEAISKIRSAKNLSLGSNISYIIGGGLLVTSSILLIVELTRSRPKAPTSPSLALEKTILLGVR